MGAGPRGSSAYEAELALRTLIKRCVQCPPMQPSCPDCGDGQICSLVPQSCDTCAHMTCIANPSPAPSSPGPNIGAIAGGVVGGVVAVAVAVFLVWFFWIRKRRAQQELADWEDEIAQQKSRRFTTTDGASTRTRQSLANSILSRASNIIQIAYIPGVTNRNGDSSGHNSMLGVAPVPPIPAAFRNEGSNGSTTPKSPLSHDGDALFFRPGDLRDSTYSATSSFRSGNRDTQYTRQSITPSLARSSMASEIYRDDASSEPMPATTVMRALPRVVSVKTSQQSLNSQVSQGTGEALPANKGVQVLIPGQGSAHATSVRGKATQVTVGPKAKERLLFSKPATQSEPSDTISHAATPSSATTAKSITPEDDAQSPFADAAEMTPAGAQPSPYTQMSSSVGASSEDRAKRHNLNKLSAVIEEGMKRASRVPSHEGLGGKRDASPFGDEHATDQE